MKASHFWSWQISDAAITKVAEFTDSRLVRNAMVAGRSVSTAPSRPRRDR
jgi:hypothetical protein